MMFDGRTDDRDRARMRLKRHLPAPALIAGLIAGAFWCVGPCCCPMEVGPMPPAIGAVSCCGCGTPSGCAPTIRRSDDLAAAPAAPSLPPVALLGHAVAASVPSFRLIPAVVAPPALSRPDLARLAIPLLI
jgi:hypothetical protein